MRGIDAPERLTLQGTGVKPRKGSARRANTSARKAGPPEPPESMTTASSFTPPGPSTCVRAPRHVRRDLRTDAQAPYAERPDDGAHALGTRHDELTDAASHVLERELSQRKLSQGKLGALAGHRSRRFTSTPERASEPATSMAPARSSAMRPRNTLRGAGYPPSAPTKRNPVRYLGAAPRRTRPRSRTPPRADPPGSARSPGSRAAASRCCHDA